MSAVENTARAIGAHDYELPPLEAYADEAGASTIPRPVIKIQSGQLHLYAAEAERLVAPEIYVRGQRLVRLGKAPELQATGQPRGLLRDDAQCVVVPVGVEFLRRRLTERADFQTYRRREKEWVSVDCPRDLAANIAAAGDWPEFNALDAIATSPFLRPDHTLCDTPGYDAASRVYFAPNANFPPVPRKPSKDDASRALQELIAPFCDFPFASKEAKAAFLSHVLTSAVRHALDVSPAYSYTAPLAGTGKTLLAGMAARIETGVPPALRPFAEDGDELRKTLLSALLAGDTSLILDNVPNGQRLRSPVLCGFVTAAVYSDRRLGVSETPRLPNRCTVVMTGNNITTAGDLARRCIIVRLDANAETSRGRDFKIDDIGRYVIEHRPRLLIAALTIARAFAEAGYPDAARSLPSFEQWSRLARDPLVWLGHADPVDTQEQEADDDVGPLRAAFAALTLWANAGTEFTARQIAERCGDGFRLESKELREAMEAAGCSDASQAQKVGYWLRANRDRVAGELKLRHASSAHNIARWKLEPV